MKNLKVRTKLFISFTVVVTLAVVVGVVGIVGMLQIAQSGDNMYREITAPLPYLARIQETLQNARVQVREMVLSAKDGDMTGVDRSMELILELVALQDEQLNTYAQTLSPGQRETLFNRARDIYENQLIDTVVAINVACKELNFVEVGRRMETCRILSDEILGIYDEMLVITVTRSQEAAQGGNNIANMSLAFIVAALIFVVVVALSLTAYITSLIGKPLSFMSRALEQVGSRGDLTIPADIGASAQECASWGDEIGSCARSFGGLIAHLSEVSRTLEEISKGNLSVNVTQLSDADNIGRSLKALLDNLNDMFGQIREASNQVTSGSGQVADGASALASGATQQAATLQQISASISDISEKTQENAVRTSQAAELAHTIMGSAEKGSDQMAQMIAAVNEINAANQNISKVIKVIDDIAFQTNILALNAAVEAARAGAAGKGFAVVAEEVRNLAAKSAESAKDTSSLIANSMQKATLGTQIADNTAKSLREIVSGIEQSDVIIAEIARSSSEQNVAIRQINDAVGGVTDVVQQNSATAEQSAAASEEMSGQANMLEGLVKKFRLR
ncbi:MAG: methyl-accepting chemotaxis protein [Oscillospiraceae bacterium]|nr:methyl-accepting chemotaxis protein [Oscillospiraceae bacterium]